MLWPFENRSLRNNSFDFLIQIQDFNTEWRIETVVGYNNIGREREMKRIIFLIDLLKSKHQLKNDIKTVEKWSTTKKVNPPKGQSVLWTTKTSTCLVYCLSVRPRAYPRVGHMKGGSHTKFLALLGSIRLGWKGRPGTKTLAYYEHV